MASVVAVEGEVEEALVVFWRARLSSLKTAEELEQQVEARSELQQYVLEPLTVPQDMMGASPLCSCQIGVSFRLQKNGVRRLASPRSNTPTNITAASSFCRCSCLEHRWRFRLHAAPRIGRWTCRFGLRCSTWRRERRGRMGGRRGRGSRRESSIGERRRGW